MNFNNLLLPKRVAIKNPTPPSVTQTSLTKPPVQFVSRAPLRALSPLPVQHPTVSNSIAASVQPFGKSKG